MQLVKMVSVHRNSGRAIMECWGCGEGQQANSVDVAKFLKSGHKDEKCSSCGFDEHECIENEEG